MDLHLLALLLSSLASLGAAPAALRQFDDLWARRDEGEAAATLERQAQLFATSTDYEELWRAASWYVWAACDERPGIDRRVVALAGIRAGERSLEQNPQGIEGKYWTALSVGLYVSTSNLLEALTIDLGARFREPLEEVIRANSSHENSRVECVGAEIALGAMYEHLPWPIPDRDRARELLERAVRARPENLRAHYMLGEFLRDEDPAAARRELEGVLGGDEGYDPPDARLQKRKAAALLKRLR